MRVLAADDDEAVASVLGRLLRRWGYDAIVVGNGAEAWRILKQGDGPRIVILDWDMPGLSGLEVCRLLRATPHGANAYVLMLTGRLAKDDIVEALESGADDFLSKPYDARELQLRLAKGVRDSARATSVERHPWSTPPSGFTLGGKYRLERKIGEGGMGSVWLGVHLSLGINVAIKFMAKHLAETADYASFEREAQAAAQLRSEHIVQVYDHGITQEGLPYLVMEYLAGESLAGRVARKGPLSPDLVASLVEQIGRALAEAHGRGVIHRDVKPENIILVEDADRPHGFVARLIDFGLARSSRGRVTTNPPPATAMVDAAAVPSTSPPPLISDAPPLVAGTPCYMSPEHLSSSAPPNALLDLWGLAVTAFFAMTGELPFQGDNVLRVYQSVTVDPLPIPSHVTPGVPTGFDAWFGLACARDPAMRFQTANELAVALRAACRDSGDGEARTPGAAKGAPAFAPTEPDTGLALALEKQAH